MRKAIVNKATGVVENIVTVDGAFDPGPGRLLRDGADARIGDTWDGARFIAPARSASPSDADLAESEVRRSRALLGLGRILLNDPALSADDLVAAIRATL